MRDKFIKVRVTEEEAEALRQLAEWNDMSVSNLIRRTVLISFYRGAASTGEYLDEKGQVRYKTQ
jgi:hypothetical protein